MRARVLALAAALAAGGVVAYLGWRDDAREAGGRETIAEPATGAAAPAPVRRSARTLRADFEATEDATARTRAMTEAAVLADSEAIAWLAEVAGSDDPLAHQAGHALGGIREPGAAPLLVELAASDRPVLVRANAVRALGAAGAVEHAPGLAALVRTPDTPLRVRQEAALAIGKLGGDDAVATALAETLAAAADEQLRISIIEGLAGIDAPAARAALERHARATTLSPTERAFLERALR